MTPPKHLWSGDWRGDSAAAAEELAARRAAGHPDPPESEPEPEVRPPAARPPEPRQPRARPRVPRRLRVVALAGILVLLAAGAAVALTDAFGTQKSRSLTAGPAYLGVKIGPPALTGGLLIIGVDPGSPAAHAGVKAGDVLSRLGGVEIHTPDDVKALMQGRRPGDQLELSVERGSYSFTADVTLTGGP